MGNRPFSRKICNFFCKLTAFYPLRHGFAVPDSPFCRYATEWGTGGCDQREQTEGVLPPGSVLALSVIADAMPPLPKGEPLAHPQTLRFSRKLYRYAKGPISEGAVAVGDWGSSLLNPPPHCILPRRMIQ